MPNPLAQARGGYRTATFYSGFNSGMSLAGAPGATQGSLGGPDVLIYSGQGRVGVCFQFAAVSGTRVLLYDAVVATSGGPFTASGHKVVGVLPGNSFIGGAALNGPPLPVFFETPFFSGLCASVLSGCAGFTVGYSPESQIY